MNEDLEELSVTQYVVLGLMNGKEPTEIAIPPSDLNEKINVLVGKRNISLTALAELSAINRATLYKLMSGTICPGRNIIIRLGLELYASYDEMQDLLKCANCSPLSGSRLRDIFIMKAVLRHESIDELDRILQKHNLESIYGR